MSTSARALQRSHRLGGEGAGLGIGAAPDEADLARRGLSGDEGDLRRACVRYGYARSCEQIKSYL